MKDDGEWDGSSRLYYSSIAKKSSIFMRRLSSTCVAAPVL